MIASVGATEVVLIADVFSIPFLSVAFAVLLIGPLISALTFPIIVYSTYELGAIVTSVAFKSPEELNVPTLLFPVNIAITVTVVGSNAVFADPFADVAVIVDNISSIFIFVIGTVVELLRIFILYVKF